MDHLCDTVGLASDSTRQQRRQLVWRFVCDATWVLSDSRLRSFQIVNDAFERTASVQLCGLAWQVAFAQRVLHVLLGFSGDFVFQVDHEHARSVA